MPTAPAELVAEFTIGSQRGRESPAVKAALEAARASGLAVETGPQETALAGGRNEVVEALRQVIESALEAGADRIEVKIEVPTQSR
jgi:uncharacterized protein YqgV (UPF0045/DUF77 family)